MEKIVYIRTKEKLHISKYPGTKSWLLLLGAICVGVAVAVCCSSGGPILQTFYISGFLAIGLCCLEVWQDCVVDRNLQRATFTRCNWYERLTKQPWIGHYLDLPLAAVTEAKIVPLANDKLASLVFVLRAGDTQSVLEAKNTAHHSKFLTRVCKEVNQFLQLNELERISWSNGSNRSSPTPSTATTTSETVSVTPSTATSSSSMPPPSNPRHRGTSSHVFTSE